MSIETVKAFFAQKGMEHRVLEFDVSSATVPLAAQALGCVEGKIAKTLSFDVKGDSILVVTAGDAKIDNANYKKQFKAKAKMLAFEDAPQRIGHAVGGVCPFAICEGVAVYLDASLRQYDTVFPACGSSNSAIELTIPELELHSGFAQWVDVCKRPISEDVSVAQPI